MDERLEKRQEKQQEKKEIDKSGEEEVMSMDALENYEKSFKQIKRGDYIKGQVVKIEDNGIYVDIGYKQEGFVPLNQLAHQGVTSPTDLINVGDEIAVTVLKCDDMEGDVILSKKRADLETAWRKVKRAYENKEIITATVVESVKGGLLVDLGLRGFVPASQVDLRPVRDLDEYVGEALKLKVIELDTSRRKVVLSRKKVLEEERIKMKEKTLNSLYEGQIFRGRVARLTHFGAFINLGGVDGLVHISEISWKRIKHPSDVLSIGEEVDVMVLKVDKKRERISLSIRQALPDPWANIDKVMSEGDVVCGRITKIAKRYIFVEVADGVEGVIPIHELADKKLVKPDDFFKPGQEVDVKILNIEKEARRMLLSYRQAQSEGSVQDINRYSSKTGQAAGSASIGDILKAKMKATDSGEEKKAYGAILKGKPQPGKADVKTKEKPEKKEAKKEKPTPAAKEKERAEQTPQKKTEKKPAPFDAPGPLAEPVKSGVPASKDSVQKDGKPTPKKIAEPPAKTPELKKPEKAEKLQTPVVQKKKEEPEQIKRIPIEKMEGIESEGSKSQAVDEEETGEEELFVEDTGENESDSEEEVIEGLPQQPEIEEKTISKPPSQPSGISRISPRIKPVSADELKARKTGEKETKLRTIKPEDLRIDPKKLTPETEKEKSSTETVESPVSRSKDVPPPKIDSQKPKQDDPGA